MIWPALIAAILPIGLLDLLRCLPRLAARLDALDDRKRTRQVQRFRDRFYPGLGSGACCNC